MYLLKMIPFHGHGMFSISVSVSFFHADIGRDMAGGITGLDDW